VSISRPIRTRLSTDLGRSVERRAIWSPLSQLSVACGVAVTAGGLVVLSGWTFGLARLKNLSPGAVSMKPNAAAAMALCGLALVMCDRRRGASRARAAVGVLAAALAGAVGVLTLLEYIIGADLGFDQLLFHEPAWSAATASPGRMAVVTAIALVLSACSLALLLRGKVVAQQAMAGAVTVIAVSALLGYAYGTDLTKPWGTTEISAYTVTLLTVLAIGLLAARPAAGFIGALLGHTTGGLMARWLLLVAVIVLPALGALRLAGQHAGLYSARAGVGIMVLASLLVLVVTVSVTAIRLNAFEGERSLALERLAESDRRLRRALEHLVRVQENERRGLATDLHDDALPALSGIGLQLELVRGLSDNDEVRERLGDAEAELRATRIRLRHLMLDLIPDALEREGLGSALRHRLEQMEQLNGIEYELFDHLGRQPSAVAGAVLYRIALEALRNVTRHADAKLVRVEIQQTDGRVDVVIADDGVGFRPSAPRRGHLGLSIMAARAELAGGGIRIDSRPGGGTVVAFWVPAGMEQALETG
jgi:signal transduction histidine kinase